MKRTFWIFPVIFLCVALPLWLVPPPPEGEEAFSGADGKAESAITDIAPNYTPWFSPLLEPAGGEVESLLFALQAALGAGVIGYWLGVSVTREKQRRERQSASREGPGGDAD